METSYIKSICEGKDFELEVYSKRVQIIIHKNKKNENACFVTYKVLKKYLLNNFKVFDEDCSENSVQYEIKLFYSARDDFLERIEEFRTYLENGYEQEKEDYYSKKLEKSKKGDSNNFGLSETEIYKQKSAILNILADKDNKNARGEASEIIVKLLYSKTRFYSIRNDDKQEIWIYDSGIYVPNGLSYIQELTRLIMGNSYTTTFCNLIKEKVIVDNYVDESDFFRQDEHKELIVVKNGILNLKTRVLTNYDPDKIFLNKLNINYNPENNCDLIKGFFEDIIGDKRDLTTIQQLFGYLLLREYRYERCFMLLGGGRNGKSKFADLIKLFINPESCTNLQPSVFENNENFSISHLYGKLANLAVDINATSLRNTGMIKNLSGRDLITVPRKFKTPISFINYAKMIFGANSLPITYDTKDAFWERWIIFEFPFTFKAEKDYYNTPEDEREFLKIRNPDIIDQITTPEQLSGLLNFALDGLDYLERNRGFDYRLSPQEVKNLWIRKSDSFAAFFNDCLENSYDHNVTKKAMKRAYSDFCKVNKIKPRNDIAIKNFFSNEGVNDGQIHAGDRIWEGVKFKKQYEIIDLDQNMSKYNGGIKDFNSDKEDK